MLTLQIWTCAVGRITLTTLVLTSLHCQDDAETSRFVFNSQPCRGTGGGQSRAVAHQRESRLPTQPALEGAGIAARAPHAGPRSRRPGDSPERLFAEWESDPKRSRDNTYSRRKSSASGPG